MTPNDDLRDRVSEGKNCKIAWIGLMLGSSYLFFIFTGIKCDLPDMPSLPDIPSFPSSQPNSNYQTRAESSHFFSGKRVAELEIPTEGWSPEVITPSDAKYYKFGNPHDDHPYFVKFSDGEVLKIEKGTRTNFGERRGIFQFRGTVPGQRVRVSISYTRPFLPSIKVQVEEEKWSEWIELPANYSWEILQAKEWFEVWFSDGRKVRVQGDEDVWVGKIPNNTFRIRGTKGELAIALDPK